MAIDIGVSKKETAEGRVKVGTVATFATPFQRIRGTVRGKALDDRLGVAILAELLEHPPEGIELQARVYGSRRGRTARRQDRGPRPSTRCSDRIRLHAGPATSRPGTGKRTPNTMLSSDSVPRFMLQIPEH